MFDNSYSTFRSKSCIYRIRQIESSEINTLLDIPETVQFNEFLDESRGDDNELDQSTVTEQSTDDDDREGDQDTTRRLNRVELIPLSVASNQKLKVVEGSTGKVGEEGDEFHMSDFHTNDDESYQLPEDLDVISAPLERNDDERDGEEM